MSTSSSLPLGKHFASSGALARISSIYRPYIYDSDKETRDRAVQGLSAFLCDGDNAKLPEKDMTKLWKGIFYCKHVYFLFVRHYLTFKISRFLDVRQAPCAASVGDRSCEYPVENTQCRCSSRLFKRILGCFNARMGWHRSVEVSLSEPCCATSVLMYGFSGWTSITCSFDAT